MKRIILALVVSLLAGCSDSSSGSGSLPYSAECGAGDGTVNAPYVLCTAADMTKLAENLNSHFILNSDIGLNTEWSPVGTRATPFTGSLDGRGYAISGLTVTGVTDRIGLFGYISRGAVSNLSIELAPGGLSGNNYVGGIAGQMDNTAITACSVEGSINGKNYVGGITGYATTGVITQVNTGASTKMGGIVGSAVDAVIQSNMALNTRIEGQRHIGRIAGEAVDCTVGVNYGIDMAIWGIQEGGLRGATITPDEARTQTIYIEMGWQFGGTKDAPWTMSAVYPVIDYWQIP
jgi:hypothetical protein